MYLACTRLDPVTVLDVWGRGSRFVGGQRTTKYMDDFALTWGARIVLLDAILGGAKGILPQGNLRPPGSLADARVDV